MALAVLQEKLGVKDYDVEEDGSIRLYEQMNQIREVSKTLYEGGVIPLSLGVREANLEQYYMDMVGEKNVEYNESNELSGEKR